MVKKSKSKSKSKGRKRKRNKGGTLEDDFKKLSLQESPKSSSSGYGPVRQKKRIRRPLPYFIRKGRVPIYRKRSNKYPDNWPPLKNPTTTEERRIKAMKKIEQARMMKNFGNLKIGGKKSRKKKRKSRKKKKSRKKRKN